ncbi:MAG: SDR family oxidoreductase [Alphaproteobacteria bacterium]|nr:SDR family oxidoreductase [Alphaproteobacteria bacterium]
MVTDPFTARLPRRTIPRVLNGQVALVTGASSGLGKATAIGLAAAGAKVVVNYIGPITAADEVVREIGEAGGEALAIEANVAAESEVMAMFTAAVKHFGALHILVNNAGMQRDAALVDMTLDQWNTVIGVNLTGQFLCAREATRIYLRQGINPEISAAAGKIICISSVHEVIPWAGHVNYASSKGGIMMLMKTMAQELAHHRIRVNSVAPGAIRTPINREAWSTPEAYEKLLKLMPYQRIGEPDDIAHAVVWLASEGADYVTGATLFVDGGMTLYPGFEDNG